MDCIDKLVHQNKSFSIHDIDKLKISHLPYSLKVLLENLLRNNVGSSLNSPVENFINWNGIILIRR